MWVLPPSTFFQSFAPTNIRSHSEILRNRSLIKLSIFLSNYGQSWHFAFKKVVWRNREIIVMLLCRRQIEFIGGWSLLVIVWSLSITSLKVPIICQLWISSIPFYSLHGFPTYYWVQIDCVFSVVCTEKYLPCTWSIYSLMVLLWRLSVALTFKFFISQNTSLIFNLLVFSAEIRLW